MRMWTTFLSRFTLTLVILLTKSSLAETESIQLGLTSNNLHSNAGRPTAGQIDVVKHANRVSSRWNHGVAVTDNRDWVPPLNEPKTPASLNDRGEASRKKGDFDNAIKDYTEAIRLDPFFEWAYNNRGLAWAAKGEFEKALSDYAEAIRIDPKYAYPYNNRGLVWMAKRDFDNAIKDYSEAIRLDPKYAFPFNNRGLVWEAKKESQKAFDDYSEAIRLDPHYANPRCHRGRIWDSKGDFAKAMADYGEAIQIDPKFAAAHNAIAWLRATCHDPQFRGGKEAIVYATKACELTDWKSYNELDTLAAAYAEAGEFTNAVIWATTAVEKAPENEKQAATERLDLYRNNRPYHRSQSLPVLD